MPPKLLAAQRASSRRIILSDAQYLREAKAAEQAARQRARAASAEVRLDANEALWNMVIESSKESNSLAMLWRPDAPVPPKVFQLANLTELRLIGMQLEALPDCVCTVMPHLKLLTLTSNELTSLPANLGLLTNLEELVLVRNKLQTLPESVGALTNLERLDLADNQLHELPDCFADLTRITSLSFDSNQLRRLPSTIAELPLQLLSANKNQLRRIPGWIDLMHTSLTSLSLMYNRVHRIPSAVCRLTKLTRLCLGNNHIRTLPGDCSGLANLTQLTADWNQIRFLPISMLTMTSLTVLSLEGNPVRMPSMEIISKGPEAVREHCLMRLQTGETNRLKAWVSKLQLVLQTITEKGWAHPSILCAESKVTINDNEDTYYAAVWDDLWEEAWPKARAHFFKPVVRESTRSMDISSAGDESEPETDAEEDDGTEEGIRAKLDQEFWTASKDEMWQTAQRMHDPYGPLLRTDVVCMFKRCRCKDEHGQPRVCVPPKPGFFCQRKCHIIKAYMISHAMYKQREHRKQQQKEIANASELARVKAKLYIDSPQGLAYFTQLAHQRLRKDQAAVEFEVYKQDVEREMQERRQTIIGQFAGKRTKLKAENMARSQELSAEMMLLKSQARQLEGWQRDLCESQMAIVQAQLDDLRVDGGLSKLNAQEHAKLQAVDHRQELLLRGFKPRGNGWYAIKASLSRGHTAEVKKYMVRLQQEYMDEQVQHAADQVHRNHKLMQKIMQNWAGVGLKATFEAWVGWYMDQKQRRENIASDLQKRQRHVHDENKAQEALVAAELAKWERQVDAFTDKVYYRHRETGERREEEPSVHNTAFIPKLNLSGIAASP